MKKQVFIKTYDESGTYKGVFFDFKFSNFTSSLNGGLGDLTVNIPRKFDEYNIDGAIQEGYELKIFITDTEAPSGVQIYSGIIDQIDLSVSSSESVTIGCSGYIHQLALDILEDSQTVAFNFASQDISATMKDILDYYQAARTDDKITYDVGATTIDTTGKDESYKFYLTSPLDALSNVALKSDSDWFWRIGVDNNFYFKQVSATPDHYFIFGKDIIDLKITRSLRDTRTGLILTNGLTQDDPEKIMKLYSDSTAITNYGRRFEVKRDGRYRPNSNDADEYGSRFIDLFKDPINTVTIRVVDSNLAGGYDIESVKAGDTCKILNITSNPALTNNMLITTVNYNIDYSEYVLADTTTYTNRELLERKKENAIVAQSDNVPPVYTT